MFLVLQKHDFFTNIDVSVSLFRRLTQLGITVGDSEDNLNRHKEHNENMNSFSVNSSSEYRSVALGSCVTLFSTPAIES